MSGEHHLRLKLVYGEVPFQLEYEIEGSETGSELINTLIEAPEVITITFNNDMDAYYQSETRIINWDITGGILLGNREHVMSPALVLAHELGHAVQHLDGRLDEFFEDPTSWENRMDMEADNLATSEFPIATESGEFLRNDYLDTERMFRVDAPTDWGTYSKPDYFVVAILELVSRERISESE